MMKPTQEDRTVEIENFQTGDEPHDDEVMRKEMLLCELLAVDYYARIKSLYCADLFSKDDAGWQALIDRAWAEAMESDALRKQVTSLGRRGERSVDAGSEEQVIPAVRKSPKVH